MVFKESAEHDFPMPHIDLVEQSIKYKVPPGKMCDLAQFDGSVSVHRTRGIMSARCHEEEAKFLALNVAHDIITGKKTVEEARKFYSDSVYAFRTKQSAPYMEKLMFSPESDTGETDNPTLSEQQLNTIKEMMGKEKE